MVKMEPEETAGLLVPRATPDLSVQMDVQVKWVYLVIRVKEVDLVQMVTWVSLAMMVYQALQVLPELEVRQAILGAVVLMERLVTKVLRVVLGPRDQTVLEESQVWMERLAVQVVLVLQDSMGCQGVKEIKAFQG